MKKDKAAEAASDAGEAPKASAQPASNVRSYFTSEVNAQIGEMTAKEMESLMRSMISSREWIAILKYTSMRTPLLDAALRSTDPVKEPSKISWSQGAMAGICDIENYVIDLNAPRVAEEDSDGNNNYGTEGIV